jgi:DNA-directed RNA polymerase specialized sigma24 family protein
MPHCPNTPVCEATRPSSSACTSAGSCGSSSTTAACPRTSPRTAPALRALARLRPKRHRALALKVAGLHYREIQERLGVTYTWVNRHVSEGWAELRSGLE